MSRLVVNRQKLIQESAEIPEELVKEMLDCDHKSDWANHRIHITPLLLAKLTSQNNQLASI